MRTKSAKSLRSLEPEVWSLKEKGKERKHTVAPLRGVSINPQLAGFTLVELLVSMTITLIILGAIVGTFVATIHAVKAAHVVAEAVDTQRGAFHILEQDLSTVFTLRDYGSYYQFHGGPTGMVMVGVIRMSDNQAGIGRVTYALNPNIRKGSVQTDVDLATGSLTFTPTMSLLRFVEPGVRDMDSYTFYDQTGTPKTWADVMGGADGSAIATELGVVCDCDPTNSEVVAALDSVRSDLLRAKKSELWIRMLSGDDTLPRIVVTEADNALGISNPRPADWYVRLNSLGQAVPLIGEDYVVAENIEPIADFLSRNPTYLAQHPEKNGAVRYFTYGYVRPQSVADLQDGGDLDESVITAGSWPRTSWNAMENISYWNNQPVTSVFEDRNIAQNQARFEDSTIFDGTGSPINARLPEVVNVSLPFVYPAPYMGAKPYEKLLDQLLDVPTAFTRTTLTVPVLP